MSGIATWIFDLDNTLYPASCSVFPQIEQRMGAFIADLLDLPLEEARRRQKAWFSTYGTTLRGLMNEHAVDPEHYLDFVHRIDLSAISANPDLDRVLAGLPGRKLVFTNASAAHAERVLDRLGIKERFEAVFDIAAAGYIPKPDSRPYHRLLERFAIDPASACMVEDTARNLEPAIRLGLTAVWVRTDLAGSQPEGRFAGRLAATVDDLTTWLAGHVR